MKHLITTSIAATFATLTIHATALAQQAEHPLGEHPAVIVKRAWANRPIDYASSFYPHPAWLWLSLEPRTETMGSPIVASVDRSGQTVATRSAAADTATTPAK